MKEDKSTGLSIFPTSIFFALILSDPLVPCPGVDLVYISKEVDINTQDTLFMPLYLTAPIPKCTVECIITSPHVEKLELTVTATPSPLTETVL